ncbi:MAG: hypothetical protein JWM21_903 [Acidobacteria bacterium]|nr:hypothetical protein [Acidobacteriota bacterium]
MKRSLIVVLLLFFALSSIGEAQRRRRGSRPRQRPTAPASASAVPCPSSLNDINDCPDTGCGPSLDPNLNVQKNKRSDDQTAESMTLQEMKDLADPEGF